MGEELRQESYVVADVPRSRRFYEDNGVQGSILGGADQADSCLSFVVPLLELILGDLARSQNSSRLHGRFPLPIDHRRSLLRESTDAISYWQEQTMGIDGGRTIDCEL